VAAFALHHKSAMKETISNHPDLTVPQLRAIAAIAGGQNFTQAAEAAEVDRSTLYDWRQHDSEFRQALIEAKYFAIADELDHLQRLSVIALQNVETALTNPDTPASVRLRASLAVLTRLKGTTEEGWATPQAIPEAQYRERDRRHLVLQQRALENGDHEFPEKPDTTKEILDSIKANTSQNPPKSPTETEILNPPPIRSAKVGRNEQCPCGSGIKFKKCCLDHPNTAAA